MRRYARNTCAILSHNDFEQELHLMKGLELKTKRIARVKAQWLQLTIPNGKRDLKPCNTSCWYQLFFGACNTVLRPTYMKRCT